MDIAAIRSQIPATRKAIYLNTGWDGPSPLSVLEAVRSQLEYEAYEGPTVPHVQERRRAIFGEARQAVASLLGVSPQEIALTENTTAGLNIVVNGLPWAPGDQAVTCSLEHSSGLVPLYLAGQRLGFTTRVVELDPQDSAEAILSKLAEAFTPHTRLLVLSHITYTTGIVMPLKELSALAHRHGAEVLVDAAQSAGQMPLDMRDLGCDYYAMPGHKWLLGPDATGALYVRQPLIEKVRPVFVSGRAVTSYDHAGSYEPNLTAIEKFDLTTRSAALYAGMTEAIRFLQGVGLAAIRERILALATDLKGQLASIPGITIHSPWTPELSCGLVAFSIAGQPPRYAQQALWERHRIMGRTVAEPPSIRLSINFFTTDEELQEVVRAVAGLAQEPPQEASH